jgi:3-oxoacyl-[acyl-carrier-protein] synthase-3
MKLDSSRIPASIAKYGNTSSVSVPLTIVSELNGKLHGNNLLLMSAFGVGMTWATAIVPFVDCHISEIVEVAHGQRIV